MDIVNSKTQDPLNMFSFGIEANRLDSNQILLSATLGQSKPVLVAAAGQSEEPDHQAPQVEDALQKAAKTVESESCDSLGSARSASQSKSAKNLPQVHVFQPQQPEAGESSAKRHSQQLESVSAVKTESVAVEDEQKIEAANRLISDFLVYRRRLKASRTKLFEEIRLVGNVRYLLRASQPRLKTILITLTALKRRGTNDKLELTGDEAERYLNNMHQLKQKIQIKNGKISLESKEEDRIELLRHIGSNENVITPFLGVATDPAKKSARNIGAPRSNRFISPKHEPQAKKLFLNFTDNKQLPESPLEEKADKVDLALLAFDPRLSKMAQLSQEILPIEKELSFINPFATFDFCTGPGLLFRVKLKDFESRKQNYIAVEVFEDKSKFRAAQAILRDVFDNCFSNYMTRKQSNQTLVNRLIRAMKISLDSQAPGGAVSLAFSLEKLADDNFLTLRHFDSDDLY